MNGRQSQWLGGDQCSLWLHLLGSTRDIMQGWLWLGVSFQKILPKMICFVATLVCFFNCNMCPMTSIVIFRLNISLSPMPVSTTSSQVLSIIVKNHVKFQWSPVKSRSVSNVEHGMKPGRVRHKLNLCVGSPVTEAYRKSGNVLESSQSYVGDGWRLCVKHREFFQNDNRKKARKWYLSWFPDWSYFPVLVRCIYTN